jgi:hypothetical protein
MVLLPPVLLLEEEELELELLLDDEELELDEVVVLLVLLDELELELEELLELDELLLDEDELLEPVPPSPTQAGAIKLPS